MLYHRNIKAIFVVVFSDVVVGIATSNYDRFFSVSVFLGFGESRGIDETVAFKIVNSIDIRGQKRLPGLSFRKYDMSKIYSLFVLTIDLNAIEEDSVTEIFHAIFPPYKGRRALLRTFITL